MERFISSMVVLVVMAVSILNAETIYLKDGSVLKGKITEETGMTILFESETEWKKLDRNNVERIVRNENIEQNRPVVVQYVNPETFKHEERINPSLLDIQMGIKAGSFRFTHSSADLVSNNLIMGGLQFDVWSGRRGLRFEYEHFSYKFKVYYSYYDSYYGYSYYTSYYNTVNVTVNPIWLSFLYRGNSIHYPYCGIGFGVENMRADNFGNVSRNIAPGLQVVLGFGGKHYDISAKFSKTDVDSSYTSIDAGGVTLSAGVKF